MSSDPGAIVLIVYYSLRKAGCSRAWFSAREVFVEIQRLRFNPQGQQVLAGYVREYMKHHRKEFPTTLLTVARLTGWLRLHVDKKPVYWFEERNELFRLKKEHVSRLTSYMPSNMKSTE